MSESKSRLKKWTTGIIVAVVLLAGYGFLALRSLRYSAPIGEPRGWMAREWRYLVDPPLFTGPSVSIPQSDISLTRKDNKKKVEWRIDTKFPGTASDYEAYNRRVHAVRRGDVTGAFAELEQGRISVSYLTLAGDHSSLPENGGQLFQMPGWQPTADPGKPNLSALLNDLETWNQDNWKTRLEMRIEYEGADVLRVRRARLIDLEHHCEAADSGGLNTFSKRHRHAYAKFEIASRYPADVALAIDVMYDCVRDIEVSRSSGAIGKGGEFEVELIGWADAAFSYPLQQPMIPGYHTQSFESIAPNITSQTFSGDPEDGGSTVLLNVRPFVRQDLITCRFEGGSSFGTRSPYPCSAPSTAPFFPFATSKPATSAKIDLARRIDRVIIPLGRLPFDPIDPEIDDLLDIPLPVVAWRDGYKLRQAIEEISGLRVEIDWSEFDQDAIAEQAMEDVTARELIEVMSAAYGRPHFDRETSTLTFRKNPGFWETLKHRLAALLP